MAVLGSKKIITSKGLEIEIVSALPDDAKAVLSFVNNVVEESEFLLISPGEFKMDVDEEKDYIKSINDSKSALFLVAKVNDEIISLTTTKTFDHRKKMAHNTDLGMSVAKRYWGQGVGDTMLGEIVRFCKSSSLEKLNLEVFSNNVKAMSLYKKHGFVEEGRDTKKYKLASGEYVDNVRMALWVGH